MSNCVKFVLSLLVPNPMRLTQRADTKTLALSGSATEANIACVMVSSSNLALELGSGVSSRLCDGDLAVDGGGVHLANNARHARF